MKSLDLKLKNLANLPTEKFLVSPMNIDTLEFHIKYKHGYNKGGLVTSCTDVTIKSRKYIYSSLGRSRSYISFNSFTSVTRFVDDFNVEHKKEKTQTRTN